MRQQKRWKVCTGGVKDKITWKKKLIFSGILPSTSVFPNPSPITCMVTLFHFNEAKPPATTSKTFAMTNLTTLCYCDAQMTSSAPDNILLLLMMMMIVVIIIIIIVLCKTVQKVDENKTYYTVTQTLKKSALEDLSFRGPIIWCIFTRNYAVMSLHENMYF